MGEDQLMTWWQKLFSKAPMTAHLFYRIVVPPWYWVASSIEALLHLRRRSAAVAILRSIRDLPDGETLSRWYEASGFGWRPDPLHGLLDFASKPWVSVAKGYGDCDDMMLIAELALKRRYDEGHRCFTYTSDGGGHATYIVRAGALWYVMSNRRFVGPFDCVKRASEFFYGTRTAYSYVY
jgi:hypothetical protein